MHPQMYGGPVHDRAYGYDAQTFKRARSDSDHNPYEYPSSQYSGGGVSQYHTSLQSSGSPWSAHPQQGFQHDQSPSFSGMAGQTQAQSSMIPGIQRGLPQAPYTAPPVQAGSNPFFGSASISAPLSRNQHVGAYSQQPHQTYDSRTSRDAYQPLPALQTSIPTTNTNLDTLHQGYLSSSTEIPGQHTGTLHAHQVPQHQETQSLTGHYGLPILPSGRSYQNAANVDSRNVSYEHNTQPEMKYDQSPFDNTQNLYSHTPRDNFNATTPNTLSEANLSLNAAMLNRSFVPPQSAAAQQQDAYDVGAGQDFTGFKQQSDPYPTPNQTSPLG